MVLREFRRNPAAMAGLGWISLVALAAMLGYLITPDSSPMANHQQLEIAAQKPGFAIERLKLPIENPPGRPGLFRRMLFGRPLSYHSLPVTDYHIKDSMLYFTHFSGDFSVEGMRDSLPLSSLSAKYSRIGTSSETEDYFLSHHLKKQRFLLGTDRFGRDMLSQLIIGARVSLSVGLIAVVISLIIGLSLGSLAGYVRGRTDDVIVWFINVIWSVPSLLLVIAISFALGRGFWQVFIAVGLSMWVEVARLVRGQMLSLREKEFAEAARALGLPSRRIIFRHLLPNIMGPVIVVSAANFASAILIEAGLSFLGMGVQPPMPSWGTMIREHYGFIILDKAYLAIWPGLAIMSLVLSFMLIGNGLRDALEKVARI